MELLAEILNSKFYTHHNRKSGCIFHDGMPYPDARERVPLVREVVHKAANALLCNEYGPKKASMLRKRLVFDPVALEIYHDKDKLVATYYTEEWNNELREAIYGELRYWIDEDVRRKW